MFQIKNVHGYVLGEFETQTLAITYAKYLARVSGNDMFVCLHGCRICDVHPWGVGS